LLLKGVPHRMKHLLVIESGLFIGEIINDMLKDRCEGMEVQILIQASEAEINRVVEQFSPDIVMVDDTTPDETIKAVLLLSLRFPNLRVVVVCADSNRIQVYDPQRIEVERMEDFLAVL
jgi:response regulator of citrate/malate metabolism